MVFKTQRQLSLIIGNNYQKTSKDEPSDCPSSLPWASLSTMAPGMETPEEFGRLWAKEMGLGSWGAEGDWSSHDRVPERRKPHTERSLEICRVSPSNILQGTLGCMHVREIPTLGCMHVREMPTPEERASCS